MFACPLAVLVSFMSFFDLCPIYPSHFELCVCLYVCSFDNDSICMFAGVFAVMLVRVNICFCVYAFVCVIACVFDCLHVCLFTCICASSFSWLLVHPSRVLACYLRYLFGCVLLCFCTMF